MPAIYTIVLQDDLKSLSSGNDEWSWACVKTMPMLTVMPMPMPMGKRVNRDDTQLAQVLPTTACTCEWRFTTYSHATTCNCRVAHVNAMLHMGVMHCLAAMYIKLPFFQAFLPQVADILVYPTSTRLSIAPWMSFHIWTLCQEKWRYDKKSEDTAFSSMAYLPFRAFSSMAARMEWIQTVCNWFTEARQCPTNFTWSRWKASIIHITNRDHPIARRSPDKQAHLGERWSAPANQTMKLTMPRKEAHQMVKQTHNSDGATWPNSEQVSKAPTEGDQQHGFWSTAHKGDWLPQVTDLQRRQLTTSNRHLGILHQYEIIGSTRVESTAAKRWVRLSPNCFGPRQLMSQCRHNLVLWRH